jgi:glycosyltransferase involved in cell wall biosynthesis
LNHLIKISIAVASYNYGRFLDDCLSSLANQTYDNFEVLIADGGSTDESLEVIKQYCDRDPRFRLVSTSDRGQSDAIQKAFTFATGDILGFLNADDMYLCNDVFQSAINAFNDYKKVSVISFKAYFITENGLSIKLVEHRQHPLDNLSWMKYRPQIVQPATFWRKEVATSVPFHENFHYVFDTVFFYQAYQKFSFLELSKPVAGYRLHGSNKSLTVRSARIFELAAFEKLKFGAYSLRSKYLTLIGTIALCCEKFPTIGRPVSKALYLVTNSISFLSFYRLPGI